MDLARIATSDCLSVRTIGGGDALKLRHRNITAVAGQKHGGGVNLSPAAAATECLKQRKVAGKVFQQHEPNGHWLRQSSACTRVRRLRSVRRPTSQRNGGRSGRCALLSRQPSALLHATRFPVRYVPRSGQQDPPASAAICSWRFHSARTRNWPWCSSAPHPSRPHVPAPPD